MGEGELLAFSSAAQAPGGIGGNKKSGVRPGKAGTALTQPTLQAGQRIMDNRCLQTQQVAPVAFELPVTS